MSFEAISGPSMAHGSTSSTGPTHTHVQRPRPRQPMSSMPVDVNSDDEDGDELGMWARAIDRLGGGTDGVLNGTGQTLHVDDEDDEFLQLRSPVDDGDCGTSTRGRAKIHAVDDGRAAADMEVAEAESESKAQPGLLSAGLPAFLLQGNPLLQAAEQGEEIRIRNYAGDGDLEALALRRRSSALPVTPRDGDPDDEASWSTSRGGRGQEAGSNDEAQRQVDVAPRTTHTRIASNESWSFLPHRDGNGNAEMQRRPATASSTSSANSSCSNLRERRRQAQAARGNLQILALSRELAAIDTNARRPTTSGSTTRTFGAGETSGASVMMASRASQPQRRPRTSPGVPSQQQQAIDPDNKDDGRFRMPHLQRSVNNDSGATTPIPNSTASHSPAAGQLSAHDPSQPLRKSNLSSGVNGSHEPAAATAAPTLHSVSINGQAQRRKPVPAYDVSKMVPMTLPKSAAVHRTEVTPLNDGATRQPCQQEMSSREERSWSGPVSPSARSPFTSKAEQLNRVERLPGESAAALAHLASDSSAGRNYFPAHSYSLSPAERSPSSLQQPMPVSPKQQLQMQRPSTTSSAPVGAVQTLEPTYTTAQLSPFFSVPSDRRPSTASSLAAESAAMRAEGIRFELEEDDIELVEEEPIISEQVSHFAVRRRLVVAIPTLGATSKSPILSKRKSSNSLRSGSSAGKNIDFASGVVSPSTGDSSSNEKEIRKREEALEARERDLTVEILSKAEMASVKMEIWTESRKGKWIVKGPASFDGVFAGTMPDLDPWSFPIDAKGIVRRNKLKSNIEVSSTRMVADCDDCNRGTTRHLGENAPCKACLGSGLVEKVYMVQCVVRLAQFTPLKLPALHLSGTKQAHVNYLDSRDARHRDAMLRDRALDGLQGAAGRVAKHHYAQHGSRLLQGRATISRRGTLAVCATSKKARLTRFFDVEDATDGQIVETTSEQQQAAAFVSVIDSHHHHHHHQAEAGIGMPMTPTTLSPSTSSSASSSASSLYGRKMSLPLSLRQQPTTPQHSATYQQYHTNHFLSSPTNSSPSGRRASAQSSSTTTKRNGFKSLFAAK